MRLRARRGVNSNNRNPPSAATERHYKSADPPAATTTPPSQCSSPPSPLSVQTTTTDSALQFHLELTGKGSMTPPPSPTRSAASSSSTALADGKATIEKYSRMILALKPPADAKDANATQSYEAKLKKYRGKIERAERALAGLRHAASKPSAAPRTPRREPLFIPGAGIPTGSNDTAYPENPPTSPRHAPPGYVFTDIDGMMRGEPQPAAAIAVEEMAADPTREDLLRALGDAPPGPTITPQCVTDDLVHNAIVNVREGLSRESMNFFAFMTANAAEIDAINAAIIELKGQMAFKRAFSHGDAEDGEETIAIGLKTFEQQEALRKCVGERDAALRAHTTEIQNWATVIGKLQPNPPPINPAALLTEPAVVQALASAGPPPPHYPISFTAHHPPMMSCSSRTPFTLELHRL